MVLTFLKNTKNTHNPFNKVIKSKEKYTSHTISRLTAFTRAFRCNRVENLLKGPG